MLRAIIGSVVLAISAAGASAQNYHLTDLGTLNGTSSSAVAVNNNGQIAGDVSGLPDFQNNTHPFLYSGGTMVDLGTPGGTIFDEANSYGINASGQVVGRYSPDIGNHFHGFLYDGTMHELKTFYANPALDYLDSQAYAINNAGVVVGAASLSSIIYAHAFSYAGGPTLQDLGTLGGHISGATSINSSGQIAGYSTVDSTDATYHVFLRTGSVMKDLGAMGGYSAQPYDVNDSGQIVGDFSPDNHTPLRAFLYSGGKATDLGALGGISSTARSINNAGQVVGYYYSSGFGTFIYRDGQMFDLGSLLDDSGIGWKLEQANDINDFGCIAGSARNSDGNVHGVLLTPVPEPCAFALSMLAALYLHSARCH
jgi:probable HAF family extracellular repeat protein